LQTDGTDGKILKVKYPPITSYQTYANLLSVILSNEDAYSWMFNILIQISKDSDIFCFSPKFTALNFAECPFLKVHKISRELINRKWGSIIRFVIDCIDLNDYIMILIDRAYIANYRMSSHWHDIFIYGYDLKNELFYTADFFRGVYSYQTVSFDNFKNSYDKYDVDKYEDWLDGAVLFKLADAKYEFNISSIKELLMDYYYSRNSDHRLIPFQVRFDKDKYDTDYKKNVYGMDCYKALAAHIIDENAEKHDIRPFHLFYDHKIAMVLLIKFLSKKEYLNEASSLLEGYKLMQNKALSARNLMLKFRACENPKIIDKVTDIIQAMEIHEKRLLHELLASI
jgi:hypothetical protein